MTSIFHHPQCKPFIRHPLKSIKCFFVSLKWAYQRVKKGYCDQDLIYGVENWFFEMLPAMIDEIKREKNTIPLVFYDEVLKSFGLNPEEYWDHCNNDLYETYCDRVNAEAERRFHDILSRISFLLQEAVWWKCSKENSYEEKYSNAKSGSPDYEEIRKLYLEEENKLDEYREKCRREAVELLLKWSSYLDI